MTKFTACLLPERMLPESEYPVRVNNEKNPVLCNLLEKDLRHRVQEIKGILRVYFSQYFYSFIYNQMAINN